MESSKPAATPDKDAAKAVEEEHSHIDDLSLQWDQTYLRLNYILGNLGGPVAAAENNSSYSSNSAKTSAEAATIIARGAPLSLGLRNSVDKNNVGRRTSKTSVLGFPALSRPDAARKVAQIATWRGEVLSLADTTLCGCSLGSSAAISSAAEAPSCSVTKGLLPVAFVAGSLVNPAVGSRRKAPVATGRPGKDEDGGSTSSDGDDMDGTSPSDSLCALCGRPGDVRDFAAESWSSDGSAARKALRRVQLGLLRFGRRKQLLPLREKAIQHDPETRASQIHAKRRHSNNNNAVAGATAASLPTGLKPAAIATTSMYHYRIDPDDLEEENLDSDDSTSTGTGNDNNAIKKQKSQTLTGASKTLAAREQMERNQRLKDARLLRAQKLLEKSLVVTPKTTGIQS